MLKSLGKVTTPVHCYFYVKSFDFGEKESYSFRDIFKFGRLNILFLTFPSLRVIYDIPEYTLL